MPDLGYALDALYSIGWWPSDLDLCVHAEDGRWMPVDEHIFGAFRDAGYEVRVLTCQSSNRCRVEWFKHGIVNGSAIGRSPREASLLAYTELVRRSSRIHCPG